MLKSFVSAKNTHCTNRRPNHGIERCRDSAESLRTLEEVVQLEGPHTIAASILETVVGTKGILIPPDGYLKGSASYATRKAFL